VKYALKWFKNTKNNQF